MNNDKLHVFFVNNVVGNVFLCKVSKESILYKRTIKLLIVLVSLGILLIPSSNHFYCLGDNSFNIDHVKLSQFLFCCNNHRITIDITDIEYILVNERLSLINKEDFTVSSLDFFFNETISILQIKEDNQNLSNYTLISSNQLTLGFNTLLDPNETKNIILEYTIENEYQKVNKDWLKFNFDYYRHYEIIYETVSVKLPKESKIYDGDGAILPPADAYGFNQGYTEIFWNFNVNVTSESNGFIQVIFSVPKNLVWLYVIGPIVGLACGIGGTVWFMRKKEAKSVKELGKIFLSENEKLILKLICDYNGKVSQGKLSSLTGFTRTKVSRNLISLEKQELIVREKWGRNYQVYITDMGKKVIE